MGSSRKNNYSPQKSQHFRNLRIQKHDCHSGYAYFLFLQVPGTSKEWPKFPKMGYGEKTDHFLSMEPIFS